MNNSTIEALAQRRVKIKLAWYAHVAIYLIVNMFLFALAHTLGRSGFAAPLLGWGLAVAIHGVVVWLKTSMMLSAWKNALLAKERASLAKIIEPTP